MFWDEWSPTDWKIYSIYVSLVVLLIWNIILTVSLILVGRKRTKYVEEIGNERIATSPVWNQIYLPKIPRLQQSKKGEVKSISSIPTPSAW
ncbi:hypothetical protein HHI36_011742 [Cryptolaemus montrouzieri]|uniref:ATP synthase F0 subunit 8 n=1 Tax=Cryptolaemus montrouzieri TaxID=559131 RepID=A0ABD2NCR4_9CUCU